MTQIVGNVEGLGEANWTLTPDGETSKQKRALWELLFWGSKGQDGAWRGVCGEGQQMPRRGDGGTVLCQQILLPTCSPPEESRAGGAQGL